MRYYIDVREVSQDKYGSFYVDSLDYDKNFKETNTESLDKALQIWREFDISPYFNYEKKINKNDGLQLCLVQLDEDNSCEEVLEVQEYNYLEWRYYNKKWYDDDNKEHTLMEGIK